MRAFFCVPIPRALRSPIDVLAQGLRSKTSMHASWVQPENYHVTLRFLGDVDASLMIPLESLCQDLCKTLVPFACHFDRVGAFPNADRARVIWVGAESPLPFRTLSNALSDGLDALDFPRARSESLVHVTLARIKDHPDPSLPRLLMDATPTKAMSMTVDRIVLMESVLARKGAVYSPLFTARFQGHAG